MRGGLGLGLGLGKENQQGSVIIAGGGTAPSLQQLLTPAAQGDLRYLFSTARILNDNYTGPLIRVRRSSDNVEQDINASGGILDESSLLTFIGANSGYLTTVYNQSDFIANADLTQSDSTKQPPIVSSGVLETSPNLRPVGFTGGTRFMKVIGGMTTSSSTNIFNVSTADTTAYQVLYLQETAANTAFWCASVKGQSGGLNNYLYFRNRRSNGTNTYRQISSIGTGFNSIAHNIFFASGTTEGYLNATAASSSSIVTGGGLASNDFHFLSQAGANIWNGKFSELINFGIQLGSTDLTTISTNQANFYG
jgi:hypothetical protein